jgi:DNA-binding NarL/FixJ family response regulator
MHRALLVDDLPSMRQHLEQVVSTVSNAEFESRQAASCAEALDEFGKWEPNLVITDISLPETSGIKLAQKIWGLDPRMKVIFWSQYNREAYVREIAKILPDDAIHGYVLKSEPDSKLIYAIESVLFEDNPYIDPLVRGVQTRLSNKENSLTDVEMETLLDVSLGLTDKAISVRRHISVRGVQNRVSMLSAKLLHGEDANVRDSAGYEVFNPRSRLTFVAIQRGLIDPEELRLLDSDNKQWLSSEYSYDEV